MNAWRTPSFRIALLLAVALLSGCIEIVPGGPTTTPPPSTTPSNPPSPPQPPQPPRITGTVLAPLGTAIAGTQRHWLDWLLPTAQAATQTRAVAGANVQAYSLTDLFPLTGVSTITDSGGDYVLTGMQTGRPILLLATKSTNAGNLRLATYVSTVGANTVAVIDAATTLAAETLAPFLAANPSIPFSDRLWQDVLAAARRVVASQNNLDLIIGRGLLRTFFGSGLNPAFAAGAQIAAALPRLPLHVPAEFSTIQAAIDAAQNGDIIDIAPGTYRENLTISGRNLTLRSDNGSSSNTILNGRAQGAVLTLNGNATVTVQGLTLTNGRGPAGGIYAPNFSGSLTIQNSTISENTATASGGGIGIVGTASGSVTVLSITNSTIRGNTAATNGGGIAVAGRGTVALSGSTIADNTAGGAGGGIHHTSVHALSLNGNTVSSNTAGGNGGGLFSTGAQVGITGGSVANNTAGGHGGGVSAGNGATTITSTTIAGNQAGGNGGGLHFDGGSSRYIVQRATIEDNVASGDGGGLYKTGSGALTVTDAVIADNQARGDGGGLNVRGTNGAAISGTRISGNDANGDGGGIVLFQSNRALLYALQGGSLLSSGNLQGARIQDNTAGGSGGGVFIQNSTGVNLAGTQISGNRAGGNGGGVAVANADNFVLNAPYDAPPVTIGSFDRTRLTDNQAGGNGGGVSVQSSANPSLAGARIDANTAQGHGGGVALNGVAAANATDLRLENNVARNGNGGGLALVPGGGARLTMQGGAFTNNTASCAGAAGNACGHGGGLWIGNGWQIVNTAGAAVAEPTTNNTFTGNTPDAVARL